MMFMIGQGERVIAIGEAQPGHCPRCEEVTGFEPQLRYRFAEFDLLFGMVYAKRYQLACPQCGHGWLLDTRQTEKELGRVPIPFRLRYGFAILLVLAAVIAVAAYRFQHAG